MPKINETTLRKYLVTLLETPRIKSFIEQIQERRGCRPNGKYVSKWGFVRYNPDGSLEYPRMLFREKIYDAIYAGVAHTFVSMEIAKWILQDADEARGVVRHELAHLLHSFAGTGGNSHGKEYRVVLKIIAPKTWRKDRHWHPNVAIEKARLKVHPNSKQMSTIQIGGRYYRG